MSLHNNFKQVNSSLSQTELFNPIDGSLTGITSPGQSGSECNSSKVTRHNQKL